MAFIRQKKETKSRNFWIHNSKWYQQQVWRGISLHCMMGEDNWLQYHDTVEPRYNEVLGTLKITLLYQVSHYIRVKKKYIKSGDQQNYLVIRGFCYIRPLNNDVPLYTAPWQIVWCGLCEWLLFFPQNFQGMKSTKRKLYFQHFCCCRKFSGTILFSFRQNCWVLK